MSMSAVFPHAVPEDTRAVGEAILDPDDLCVFLGQQGEALFPSALFSDLYADSGRPSVSPLVLAIVTLLQFVEDLPDRKACEQVVRRIDWKYALHQELTWTGFDYSDLCRFRQRLLEQGACERLFDQVLQLLKSRGYVKKRGSQRTDSTHVLAQVARLSRAELKAESLRLAVVDLMSSQAAWVLKTLGAEYVQTYSQLPATYRLSRAALEHWERELETAGQRLLRAVETDGQPAWCQLRGVALLYAIFVQQQVCVPPEAWASWGAIGLPADGGMIESPHEPEARYSEKRGQGWVGYKTHITDVWVTLAPQHDSLALERIQARLIQRDVCPARQYVDQGYMSAEHIVGSANRGIDLRGEVQASPSSKPVGFRLQDFQVDMQQQLAHCPAGQQSVAWTAVQGTKGVAFRAFFGQQCRTCPHFTAAACTTLAGGRRLDISPHHDTLQARRQEQQSRAFRQEMEQRAGIEATISASVRVHGLRRNRYRGIEKTQGQAAFTAAAVNLKRLTGHLAAA